MAARVLNVVSPVRPSAACLVNVGWLPKSRAEPAQLDALDVQLGTIDRLGGIVDARTEQRPWFMPEQDARSGIFAYRDNQQVGGYLDAESSKDATARAEYAALKPPIVYVKRTEPFDVEVAVAAAVQAASDQTAAATAAAIQEAKLLPCNKDPLRETPHLEYFSPGSPCPASRPSFC